jgi:hypothetical protein
MSDDAQLTLDEVLKSCTKKHRLREQLLSNSKRFLHNLCLDLAQRCRYEDGYILQDVFACKTCYIDQLRKLGHSVESNADYERLVRMGGLVKPHGFCFGCMLTCHKSHDWFELKMRMSFRCDCGNGRMPHGCLLASPDS